MQRLCEVYVLVVNLNCQTIIRFEPGLRVVPISPFSVYARLINSGIVTVLLYVSHELCHFSARFS